MHFPYTVSQSCTHFPIKGSLLFHMQVSLSNVKLAVSMTRLVRPVPTPSYTHHSYHLIPQSLSQSIFYEIAAGNVALSSFL
ncbi:hypothetical protein T01_2059 [Trichinella spiralis]|uniref:Uncharacterized protein n=1 Tax=Trichinella spiralis TaxID=6334 RepID=A0A0V1AME8_TRISP|nr:hypothetical protein T01_2059 [Trichinella spiralis]